MPKKAKLIGSIVAVLLIIYAGYITFAPVTRTMGLSDGTATFESNANQKLTMVDEFMIKVILNHNILYTDSPACGFTDEVSVSFNGGEEQFWLACDMCATVYDKKEDKYFMILPLGKEILYSILGRYGFSFPCV